MKLRFKLLIPRNLRSDTGLDDLLCNQLHSLFVSRVISIVHREIEAIGSVDLNINQARAGLK